jgi:uncharacterized membrane protein (UPF0127 family)
MSKFYSLFKKWPCQLNFVKLCFLWTVLFIILEPVTIYSGSLLKSAHCYQAAFIQLGPKSFWVEFAQSPTERAAGLMFRPQPKLNQGMLFKMTVPEKMSFWMKNTPSSLSIAFFDMNNILIEIRQLEPYNEKVIYSKKIGVFALEMRKNWFKKNKIKPGHKLKILKIKPVSEIKKNLIVPLN